jgi:dTDP-4-dehydrorhamnose reductase
MEKILIVGSKGMAGHVVYQYLQALGRYIVEDISRDNSLFNPTYTLDVTDFDNLGAVIRQAAPQYIINCIGILNQEAESHPDKAILINSYLPHCLAKTANSIQAKLIHISTDCVFNGNKGGYKETDIKDGIGFYAQSKALGEVTYTPHLTVRTSIIGPELKGNGIGLFDWFMKQQGEIKGYTRAFWTGVTTLELAKAIPEIIKQDLNGLIHLVNDEKISKYDLLDIFNTVFERPVQIVPFADYQVDKSLVNTSKAFDYKVPDYSGMVEELKMWMLNNKSIYQKYFDH